MFNDDTTVDGFGMEVLRQMLKDVGKHGEISLLYDNDSNILVSDYYMLYLSRCYTYKNAKHYFDFEKVIKAKMEETKLGTNGVLFRNYEFVESKENELIQISDVFVGLLAKTFKYIDSVTVEDLINIDREKYKLAISNISKLYELIEKAERKHAMLIQNVNDIALTKLRMMKLEILIGGEPHEL